MYDSMYTVINRMWSFSDGFELPLKSYRHRQKTIIHFQYVILSNSRRCVLSFASINCPRRLPPEIHEAKKRFLLILGKNLLAIVAAEIVSLL